MCSRHHALTGIVRDRYQPSVHGVGIQGEVVNDFRIVSTTWTNMVRLRILSKKTFIGCTVSNEFQHF